MKNILQLGSDYFGLPRIGSEGFGLDAESNAKARNSRRANRRPQLGVSTTRTFHNFCSLPKDRVLRVCIFKEPTGHPSRAIHRSNLGGRGEAKQGWREAALAQCVVKIANDNGDKKAAAGGRKFLVRSFVSGWKSMKEFLVLTRSQQKGSPRPDGFPPLNRRPSSARAPFPVLGYRRKCINTID